MYVSIDLVEEVIERQLRKYKTKIIGKHKDGGNLRKEFIEKENEGEEEEVKIIRTKQFGMKPMFPEVYRWNCSDTVSLYSVMQIQTKSTLCIREKEIHMD